ncbi:MAG: hypothetical protein C4523_07685 [Myxococcales bacterium]|nr:MAG: hypothetical protein C4523_07685 [Myxococcales bacterium]
MYPLVRRDDRRLASGYAGLVVTCDVDKTYLDTDFKSWRGLLSIPLEWAEDKLTIAGMAPVLRDLRAGPGAENAQTPFYFLTASPPFLYAALKRKLLIDAVQADGATFKDWRTILLSRRRPAWLKRQVAYKLAALLHQRRLLPPGSREILIGDDVEHDALIYSAYADAAAGRIAPAGLARLVVETGGDEAEAEEVREAAAALGPPAEAVQTAYILLVSGASPDRYRGFGDGLVACASPFQMAVHLFLSGLVKRRTARDAAFDLVARSAADRKRLHFELEDGAARSLWSGDSLRPLQEWLSQEGLTDAPTDYPPADPSRCAEARAARGGRWLAGK